MKFELGYDGVTIRGKSRAFNWRGIARAAVPRAHDRESTVVRLPCDRVRLSAASRRVLARSLRPRTWAASLGNGRRSTAACVLVRRAGDETPGQNRRADPPHPERQLARAEDLARSGGRLHDRAAYAARAIRQAGIKTRENLRQLSFDIADGDSLHMQLMAAVFAVPRKAIEF